MSNDSPALTRHQVRINYYKYIASAAWRKTREAAIERAGRKCQLCSSTHRLSAHHNTYDRLGCELPTDLVVLCGRCHRIFHARLDVRTRGPVQEELSRQGVDADEMWPDIDPAPQIVHADIQSEAMRRVQVTVTQEYIDLLLLPGYGLTPTGLSLIGETKKPKSWKSVIGKTVEVCESVLEAERALAAWEWENAREECDWRRRQKQNRAKTGECANASNIRRKLGTDCYQNPFYSVQEVALDDTCLTNKYRRVSMHLKLEGQYLGQGDALVFRSVAGDEETVVSLRDMYLSEVNATGAWEVYALGSFFGDLGEALSQCHTEITNRPTEEEELATAKA